MLNARPWVARGLPSLPLDVASPTPHAGGAGPSLERGGVCSTHPRGVRLRRALVRGNLVISQRKMRQRTAVGVDSRVPALDLLNSSQRVSRSGSARLGPQKGGLPIHCGSSYYRFKAIDARLRGSFPRLPLNSVAARKEKPTEAGLECQRRSAAGPPLRLENVGLWYFSSGMPSPNQRAPGVSASNHRPKAAPARADC